MQYALPILSFGFYGQIYLLFTTVFYCREKDSPTTPYLKCKDSWFNNFKPFAGLAMFLHLLIAFITNNLYYQPTFVNCKTDLLQKTNSFPDVMFLFVKVLIISLFIMDKGEENEHWAIICFLILVTGINAYFTLFYQNRKNIVLLNLNNIFCLILFTGFIILLIGKIMKVWNFNGSIFLLASLITIIFIFFVFHKSYNPDFIVKDYRTIFNPDEFLQYILRFSEFVRNKNKSRNHLIVMTGLISSMEEKCIDPECPLKKYLINLKKGIDSEYYLLQFVETLYQYGINKFPQNIFLKNYYSSFLIMEMNNKKKAVVVNNDIKEKIFSMQMNYSIYRCHKIIENYSSPFINKNNSIFNYRKDVQDFRTNIERISLLYFDFISLLLVRKMENVNNFEKINEIGYKIKKLLKKTEDSFDKLINIKIDNYEIIKLYSELAENILNDEDKIQKCKNFLKIKNTNNIIEIQEKDYSNFNLEVLKESDNFFYLIILTRNKDLGIISDCSKNLCNLLGYTKNELVGKDMNVLLPKIFHEKHKEIIKQKSEEHKLIFFEKLYTNSIYSPDVIEKDIYCISKSKLIIPLTIKTYLVNNEENELVYVVEFTLQLNFTNDLLKKINISENQKHCVLTDKNFVIQSFTANCLNFLKFRYEDIGANYNILNFIKQFRQDYILAINSSSVNKFSHMANTGIFSIKDSSNDLKNIFHNTNNNAKSGINDIKKMKLKKDLFNQKYNKKCRITWSHFTDDLLNSTKIMQKYHQLKNSFIKNDSIISFDDFKILNHIEIDIYMEAKKIILGNELIGYYFYFSNLCAPKPNIFFNYKIESRETSVEKKNDSVKKSKKYQVVIKSNKYLTTKKLLEEQASKKNDPSNSVSFNRDADDLSNIKFLRKSVQEPKAKYRRKSSKTYIRRENNEQMFENIAEDDFIINGDFVPTNPYFIDFDHNNGSYVTSVSKNEDKFPEIQKEAEEKMNKIIKIKIESKRKTNKIFDTIKSSDPEEGEYITSSDVFTSSSNGDSDKVSPRSSYISKKNSIKKVNSITKRNRIERKIQNINFNKNVENIGDVFLGRNKKQVKKRPKRSSLSIKDLQYYHFYKVDLRHARLLIFNFQKESIEEKSHNNYSEIENLLYNLKKDIPVEIGRDEDYPTMIINNKSEEKKDGIDKTEINKNSDVFKIMDKDKILRRKIVEAINNYKDEVPVKKLKILSIVSFLIMFAFGLLNYYLNTSYYTTFQNLISLIQASLGLKYYNLVSIFYIRELTILNFDIKEIEGGYYTDFPANNRSKYKSYLSQKLTELYIANHNLVKVVLGTAYSISKNSSYYLTEELFDMKFLTPDNEIKTVKYDINKVIIAYNTAFGNLASSNTELEQNHSDLLNYLRNSFGEFEKGFDILYSVYNYELEILRSKIKLYLYLLISFILISYLLIYLFSLKYFLSSNVIRINYIKIFYSINSKTLKDLMKNCSILIDKFRTNQKIETSREEDEEENEYISNNKKIKFNENIENSTTEVENNQKNRNIYFSYLSLFFIGFFFLLMALFFLYFIYISKYFYNLYNKSLSISSFSKYFYQFQFGPMKIYNAYREFIFDNISSITDLNPYDYLRYGETEIYNSIYFSRENANLVIGQLAQDNPSIREYFTRNFCSFEIIEYFNLTEDCINRFGYLSRFNLDKDVFYFLEELRIKKNIIKYILDNFNVVGNLTEYNKDNMIKKYKESSDNNLTIFRLNLFNIQYIHSNVNYMYFNIILQIIEHCQAIISFFTIDGKNSYFILLTILYVLALCLMILIFIVPMIKFLNKQIYTAKNILSIVPVNVLLYQRNNSNLFRFFKD